MPMVSLLIIIIINIIIIIIIYICINAHVCVGAHARIINSCKFILILQRLSYDLLLFVFHRSLIDRQSVQISRTHLNILDVLGHWSRSKNKLISDFLLWSPKHGRASFGQPARTYLHWLCADAGCSLEDLSGVIDDRDYTVSQT